MGNFYKKNFQKKLFPLGAKRENTLEKGPGVWNKKRGPQSNRLMKIKYAPIVHLYNGKLL